MIDVLIVDDDRWVSDQYASWCERSGWRTATAEHALGAIDEINTQLPRAIVLDMFLPGPNALTLLHELQSYQDTAQLPIVLCTSSARELRGIDMRAYGVRYILDKTTLDRAEFTRVLKGVLA